LQAPAKPIEWELREANTKDFFRENLKNVDGFKNDIPDQFKVVPKSFPDGIDRRIHKHPRIPIERPQKVGWKCELSIRIERPQKVRGEFKIPEHSD
jgi:hypothetical protein